MSLFGFRHVWKVIKEGEKAEVRQSFRAVCSHTETKLFGGNQRLRRCCCLTLLLNVPTITHESFNTNIIHFAFFKKIGAKVMLFCVHTFLSISVQLSTEIWLERRIAYEGLLSEYQLTIYIYEKSLGFCHMSATVSKCSRCFVITFTTYSRSPRPK